MTKNTSTVILQFNTCIAIKRDLFSILYYPIVFLLSQQLIQLFIFLFLLIINHPDAKGINSTKEFNLNIMQIFT